MDRRFFLSLAGLVFAGCWLGVRGLFGAGARVRLKEASHYSKLDQDGQGGGA